MKLKIINSVRTNNFNDELMMKKITGLWEESASQLTSPESITYSVYHKYESNYKGDYTLSLTIEDATSNPSLEVPRNAKYEVFKVDANQELGILNTWKDIWKREEAGTLDRAYTYDFEKYYPNGEIEIYIAIK